MKCSIHFKVIKFIVMKKKKKKKKVELLIDFLVTYQNKNWYTKMQINTVSVGSTIKTNVPKYNVYL